MAEPFQFPLVFPNKPDDTGLTSDLKTFGNALTLNPLLNTYQRNVGGPFADWFWDYVGRPLNQNRDGFGAPPPPPQPAPTSPQPGGGLDAILQGLFQGSEIPLGPAPQLPAPPQQGAIPGLDFGPYMAALEASAPKGPTEEENKDDRIMGILGGLAAGLLQGDGSIGGALLGAGAGGLGGLVQTSFNQRDQQRDFQRQQQEFQLRRAGGLLNVAQAEQENQIANARINASNAQARYASQIAALKSMQPEILSTANGMLVYKVNTPEGQQVIRTDPTMALQQLQMKMSLKAMGLGDDEIKTISTLAGGIGVNEPFAPIYDKLSDLAFTGELDGFLASAGVDPEEVKELALERAALETPADKDRQGTYWRNVFAIIMGAMSPEDLQAFAGAN